MPSWLEVDFTRISSPLHVYRMGRRDYRPVGFALCLMRRRTLGLFDPIRSQFMTIKSPALFLASVAAELAQNLMEKEHGEEGGS
jgi:hypothetical protein